MVRELIENINLENVKLICAIEITDSRIEGAYDKTLAYGKRDPTRWLTDEWGGQRLWSTLRQRSVLRRRRNV